MQDSAPPATASPPRARPADWTPGRILFAAVALVGAYFAFRLAITLSQLWIMLFAALIVAVMIRSAADPIERYARAPSGVAVGLAVLLILGGLGGLFYIFGSQLSAQAADLARRLPLGWERVQSVIANQPWGPDLMGRLEQSGGYADRALTWAQSFAMTTAAALTGLLLVFVAGVYLALSPGKAREGLLGLMPRDRRPRLREVMNACGAALKGWLRAQLLAMTLVGLLTGVGLALIGVPSPVALGVLTGLLDFVPIVGPVAATVPAMLMAATVGWQEAALTLALYVAVQQVESVLIMPLAQKSVAQLPVILTVFSVVAFTTLFGPLGALFSAPLALVIYVLVTMLYRQDVLKDTDARAPGEGDET
jgi:predicted PurR-regulated permease PerM